MRVEKLEYAPPPPSHFDMPGVVLVHVEGLNKVQHVVQDKKFAKEEMPVFNQLKYFFFFLTHFISFLKDAEAMFGYKGTEPSS